MRLIDADDRKLRTELVYYTCWTGIDEAPYLFAVDVLDKAPTVDAVQVIHCKDCKYADNTTLQVVKPFCDVEKEDFCAWAKRKEE